MTLKNYKILLAITCSIAIYKAAEILYRFTLEYGAEVQVVMTSSAQKCMTLQVCETLSEKNVYCSKYY